MKRYIIAKVNPQDFQFTFWVSEFKDWVKSSKPASHYSEAEITARIKRYRILHPSACLVTLPFEVI